MTNDTNSLLSTTDPMVWAEEFCKMFYVLPKEGEIPATEVAREWAVGLMVGWFANAFETGRREAAQAVCPHTDRFTLSEDLMACRECGKLFDDD